MNYKFLLALIAVAISFTACKNGSNASNESDKDTDSVAVVPEKPDLVGDSVLTSTAKYYADMVSTENGEKILTKVDELVSKDMKDVRESCNYVFYPFSGPDFLYPHTILPDADCYFMIGLERPGSKLKMAESGEFVDAYKKALRVYLGSSFFITKEMNVDLSNEIIDGTLPVISMLVAKEGCQIISIKYKDFAEGGKMVDAENDTKANAVEVQFFSPKTPKHLQTIYYFSGNAANGGIDQNLVTYLNNTLSKNNVITFLKAASYIMHHEHYSTIRDIVLNNSQVVLGDDSGIPYRDFDKNIWDITLYGAYKHPQSCFSPKMFQPDLDSIYKSGVARPLDFKIGYNRPSNWMIARKKK